MTLGLTTLKNRYVMAPMTRNRAGEDGVPTSLNALYYAQRSSAGLVVTEGTYPARGGRAYIGQPGISTEAQADGWKLVTDAVHQNGGAIFLQMHHAGRLTHSDLLGEGQVPLAPSAIAPAGEVFTRSGRKAYPTPRAMEARDIERVEDEIAQATRRASGAGFDGIEINAGNGYLPHTFLSNRTNRRTDDHGGSLENRARFLLRWIDVMAGIVGSNRVAVKLNAGPFPLHDIITDDEHALWKHLLPALAAKGIAYLHVQRSMDPKTAMQSADYDVFAFVREHYAGTLIGGGAVTIEEAERLIAKGTLDAAAFGTPFIANPDFPLRTFLRLPLRAPDPATVYIEGPAGYADYPFASEVQ